MLDGERSKLGKEVTELQVRVARDEEKEEEARKTSFDLKQKVDSCCLFFSLLIKTTLFINWFQVFFNIL